MKQRFVETSAGFEAFDYTQMRDAFMQLIRVGAGGHELEFEMLPQMPEHFYEWWPKLWPLCETVALSGREPLNCESLFEVFDYFGDLGESGKLNLTVITPLLAPFDVVERFIMKSHYVRNLNLKLLAPTDSQFKDWIKAVERVLAFGRLQTVEVTVANPSGDGNRDEIAVANWLEQTQFNYRPGFLRATSPSNEALP